MSEMARRGGTKVPRNVTQNAAVVPSMTAKQWASRRFNGNPIHDAALRTELDVQRISNWGRTPAQQARREAYIKSGDEWHRKVT